MRGEIQRALHQELQRFAVASLQALEARAKLDERCELGCSGRNGDIPKGVFDDVADRAIAGDRRDLHLELPLERRRERTAAHEIVELRIAQQRRHIGTRRPRRDSSSGLGNLAQQCVAQQRLQKACARSGGVDRRPCRNQRVDPGLRQKRRDVIGLEQFPRRNLAGLHERGFQREAQLGERRGRHTRTPWDPKALQRAGGDRIRCGDESHRLQILADERAQVLQVMATEHIPYTVRSGERFGTHHVGEIRVGIGRIVTLADPRDLIELRAPEVVA